MIQLLCIAPEKKIQLVVYYSNKHIYLSLNKKHTFAEDANIFITKAHKESNKKSKEGRWKGEGKIINRFKTG